jgi:uncharacterized pyridoxamine 5'-phosphate oxidase family protein
MITGKCMIGDISETKKGLKITNPVLFPIERKTLIFALKALGKRATIQIKNNNSIEEVIPNEKNSYLSTEAHIEFSGFTLRKLDMLNSKIEFTHENSKKIYVRAFAPPSIQQKSLSLLGKKVNFVISTKDKRYDDRNKRITNVDNYRVLEDSTQCSSESGILI